MRGLWFLMPLSKLFTDPERYLNILNSGLIIRAPSFLFVCALYRHLLTNMFEPRLTQRSQLNRTFFLLFLELGCTSHLSLNRVLLSNGSCLGKYMQAASLQLPQLQRAFKPFPKQCRLGGIVQKQIAYLASKKLLSLSSASYTDIHTPKKLSPEHRHQQWHWES